MSPEHALIFFPDGDDSGDDSGDEHDRREEDEDEDEGFGDDESASLYFDFRGIAILISSFSFQPHDRPGSPDALVVLSTKETLGPSEEAETEFAKELAKMVSDSSGESRKVDKRTALALWDTSALPGGIRKKRTDDAEGPELDQEEIMKFTLISKKGGKTQVSLFFVSPIEAVSSLHRRVASFLFRRHQH